MTAASAFLGFVGGIVCGATLAWIALGSPVYYGRWLGRKCWVRPCCRVVWSRHVVVAVSWKGAVCVRPADEPDDGGYWIKKENVEWRVRWDEPREERG